MALFSKMASLVEALARQAHLTFSKNFGDDIFVDCLTKLKRLLNQVKSPDVNLNRDILRNSKTVQDSAPVTYVSLCENDKFSMGIFVVRSGARIPLHDHPGMYGMLKVLHGKLSILSYNRVTLTDRKIPRDLLRKVSSWQRHLLVPSKKNEIAEVTPESEPCVLTPIEANYHEIQPIGGTAAFLDILAPPYMSERDCHYYQHVCDRDTNEQNISWLMEVASPMDFWCDSAPYSGPDINLD